MYCPVEEADRFEFRSKFLLVRVVQWRQRKPTRSARCAEHAQHGLNGWVERVAAERGVGVYAARNLFQGVGPEEAWVRLAISVRLRTEE